MLFTLVCVIISDLHDIENGTQNAFYKVAPEESLNILFLNPNLPINADENKSGVCCSQREGGWLVSGSNLNVPCF